MTEHVCEWVFCVYCQSYWCNHFCGKTIELKEAERRLNATERLSAWDARFASKRIDGSWDDDEGTVDSLRAYANILEGKDE